MSGASFKNLENAHWVNGQNLEAYDRCSFFYAVYARSSSDRQARSDELPRETVKKIKKLKTSMQNHIFRVGSGTNTLALAKC